MSIRIAAFLRGLNLGRRRLKNTELCAAFEGLGYTGVAAFLASGNVVFEAAQQAGLREHIEAGLRAAFQYQVPTFLRDAAQLRALAAFEGWGGPVGSGKPQVIILREETTARAREQVLALADGLPDRLVFGERALFWLPEGRLTDSSLDFASIERTIGPTTTRTQRTLQRMVAKFF